MPSVRPSAPAQPTTRATSSKAASSSAASASVLTTPRPAIIILPQPTVPSTAEPAATAAAASSTARVNPAAIIVPFVILLLALMAIGIWLVRRERRAERELEHHGGVGGDRRSIFTGVGRYIGWPRLGGVRTVRSLALLSSTDDWKGDVEKNAAPPAPPPKQARMRLPVLSSRAIWAAAARHPGARPSPTVLC